MGEPRQSVERKEMSRVWMRACVSKGEAPHRVCRRECVSREEDPYKRKSQSGIS